MNKSLILFSENHPGIFADPLGKKYKALPPLSYRSSIFRTNPNCGKGLRFFSHVLLWFLNLGRFLGFLIRAGGVFSGCIAPLMRVICRYHYNVRPTRSVRQALWVFFFSLPGLGFSCCWNLAESVISALVCWGNSDERSSLFFFFFWIFF